MFARCVQNGRNAFNFIYLFRGIDLFICINLTRLRQQLCSLRLQAINCLHCSTQVRCPSLLFLLRIFTLLYVFFFFFSFMYSFFMCFLHFTRTSQRSGVISTVVLLRFCVFVTFASSMDDDTAHILCWALLEWRGGYI